MKEKSKDIELDITFLVGNGFDISILSRLNKQFKTTYKEFYDYLVFYLKNKSNFIYEAIENSEGTEIWRDFELVLGKAVLEKLNDIQEENPEEVYDSIINDWKEIQFLFADFMNLVITPDTLKEVGMLDSKPTLEQFLGDLTEKQNREMNFPGLTDHHMTLNYNFINFNYSSLLDNFIYSLFDPHPYRQSENNAEFNPNPKNFPKCQWYDKFSQRIKRDVRVMHPHGTISVPSSVLFGTSSNNDSIYNSQKDKRNKGYYRNELKKRLDKPYWSQFDKEIEPILKKTNLFVVFGHSLGETDKRWWKAILKLIAANEAEMIIYDYQSQNLKEKFLDYEPVHKNDVKDRIFVVDFDESNPLNYGFNFGSD